ncbi:hypothetical protein ACRTEC_16285 [Janibacter indicus]
MTRTHWLLVILMGLLAWGFGYIFDVPAAEFVGFVVTIGVTAGLLLGGDAFSDGRPRGGRRRRSRR